MTVSFCVCYLQSSQSIHTPKFAYKVVVQVIIIDQWYQTPCLHEIQVPVIYSRAILVTVTLECHVKRFICKTWTGTLAKDETETVQTQIRCCRTRLLIRDCTICLIYRKLRVNWNSYKSQSGLFLQLTIRDNRPTSAVSALTVYRNRLLWLCTGIGNLTKHFCFHVFVGCRFFKQKWNVIFLISARKPIWQF